MPDHRFLHALGLIENRNLRKIEERWVSLDQLFGRFKHQKSYKWHLESFQCNQTTWESLYPLTFSLSLLELLVFPPINRRININLFPLIMATFRGNLQVNLVPMNIGRDIPFSMFQMT